MRPQLITLTIVRVIAGTFDTTLKPLLDDVRKKKVIVLEVTNAAEVECKLSPNYGSSIFHLKC